MNPRHELAGIAAQQKLCQPQAISVAAAIENTDNQLKTTPQQQWSRPK